MIVFAQNASIHPNYIPLGCSLYNDQPRLLQKGRKQKKSRSLIGKTACTAFYSKGATKFFYALFACGYYFVQSSYI